MSFLSSTCRSLLLAMSAIGIFSVSPCQAQTAAPPQPQNGPSDPPLLPAETQPRGRAARLTARPAPQQGLTDIPSDEVTASPELIIDAGGFLESVADVAISPDSRLIAASGVKIVRIIDAATGQTLTTLRGDHSRTSYGNTNGVAFSPDGQFLLVGVHDDHAHGSIRMYRTDRLDEIDSLLPGMDGPCTHVEFSRDGRYLATVDNDGQIFLWDWPSRRILKVLPAPDPDKPIIDALQFADAEPYLMALYHDGPYIYRVPDGAEINAQQYMPPRLLGWMYDVLQKKVTWPFPMKWFPRMIEMRLDQNVWAAAGESTENGQSRPWIGLWTPRTMNPQAPATSARVVYRGHRWNVYCAALSPNGDFVVSGDKFGEVHIWDAKTGVTRHRITSQGQPIYMAAFARSNDRIVFGTQPDLAKWGFNNYGVPSRILDLTQRTIHRLGAEQVETLEETPTVGGATASLLGPAAGQQSFHVALQKNGRQTQYRMPSGRIPSCYTVLSEPKLGVETPVLYADNLNFLAMWNTAGDELRRAYRGHLSMVTSISPSSNGRVFITGSTDRTMRIWSLMDYQPTGIFDFKYENSSVIRVKPGSSSASAGVQVGDRIVSFDGHSLEDVYQMMLYKRFNYKPGQTVPVVMERGSRKYQYRMRLDEGFDYVEPLLNIFIGDNDQWIMWTPQGYYDCSPGADQLIGWHVNQGPHRAAKFYRVQQFRKQLYRPDIINEVIRTGVLDGQGLGDRQAFAAVHPPVVTITGPQSSSTFEDPRVTVTARVNTVNDLPIRSVTLLHNGTPARVFKPANENDSRSMEISHRLRLFPGRNEIAFIAENLSATSAAEESRIVLDAPAAETKAKVYVLAIGIADYANNGNGIDNLQFSANDARAFSDIVKSHAKGRLYSDVDVRLLTNEQATRMNILDGLQWLVDNVQQGDVVMLFSSGHGFLDDKDNFYLGTHEVDPSRLRATGVSWREIIGFLHEDLPACQRLVFLDACHAEGIGKPTSQNPLHELAAPELGTVFYASCSLQQKSFENEEWRHGAFTKAILDVLEDKRADVSPSTGDGLVNTVELGLGVTDRVSTMTGDRQNPQVYSPVRLKKLNVLEFLR